MWNAEVKVRMLMGDMAGDVLIMCRQSRRWGPDFTEGHQNDEQAALRPLQSMSSASKYTM